MKEFPLLSYSRATFNASFLGWFKFFPIRVRESSSHYNCIRKMSAASTFRRALKNLKYLPVAARIDRQHGTKTLFYNLLNFSSWNLSFAPLVFIHPRCSGQGEKFEKRPSATTLKLAPTSEGKKPGMIDPYKRRLDRRASFVYTRGTSRRHVTRRTTKTGRHFL